VVTVNQYTHGCRLPKKYHKWKRRALAKSPQKIGKCLKVFRTPPKKPCSADRPVAFVRLKSGIRVYCHIPGIDHKLRPGEEVIICGHGPNDLPYTKYHVIRGPRFDLSRIVVTAEWGERISSRSVYGLKKKTLYCGSFWSR